MIWVGRRACNHGKAALSSVFLILLFLPRQIFKFSKDGSYPAGQARQCQNRPAPLLLYPPHTPLPPLLLPPLLSSSPPLRLSSSLPLLLSASPPSFILTPVPLLPPIRLLFPSSPSSSHLPPFSLLTRSLQISEEMVDKVQPHPHHPFPPSPPTPPLFCHPLSQKSGPHLMSFLPILELPPIAPLTMRINPPTSSEAANCPCQIT